MHFNDGALALRLLPAPQHLNYSDDPVQATKTMVSVSQGQLEKLSELTATPTSQLKFVLDAWAQVGHAAGSLPHSCQPQQHALSCLQDCKLQPAHQAWQRGFVLSGRPRVPWPPLRSFMHHEGRLHLF